MLQAESPYLVCVPLQITLSVVGIYCEPIRDLLAPPGSNADNLAVRRVIEARATINS